MESIADRPLPSPRQFALGSLFWLCVLLALEPGNLLHGTPPSWIHEAVRLSMASLLGGMGGLGVFWLARRQPITSWRCGRALAVHAIAISALALILLVIGNVLAWLFLAGPGLRKLHIEIAANFLLLVAGLSALDGVGHFLRKAPRPSAPSPLRHLTVKDRRGAFQLSLDSVERIESQENYVALHTASESHLYRSPLASLLAQLDQAEFIRIHRSIAVNRAHILRTRPMGNGKTQIELRSGASVTASRAYSAALRALQRDQP